MNDRKKLRDAMIAAYAVLPPGSSALDYPSVRISGPVLWELMKGAMQHELTLPRTKMVEVWHVEMARRKSDGGWIAHVIPYDHVALAEHRAARPNSDEACIRVTGPHQQEVPV